MPLDTIELEKLVHKAESGFQKWKDMDMNIRIKAVRQLRKAVQQKSQILAEAISIERCRPLTESLTQEVLSVLEMAKFCEKNYSKWLSNHRIPYRRPGFFRNKNILTREPLGIVAIFSPGNFPFSLGMMAMIYTILAGNTVILKPSEKSQKLPMLIEQLLNESRLTELGAGILIPGGPETGEYLIQHPSVQKIIFFGHQKTGDKIAHACIKHCKPFILESGGGSTSFVLKDADLELAASGLAWSAFYANGQSCVSTERIFIDRAIEEEFLLLFKKETRAIWNDRRQNPSRIEFADSDQNRYKDFINTAESEGADIYYIEGKDETQSFTHFCPTIISNISSKNNLLKEEIFGPLVTIVPIDDIPRTALYVNKAFSTLGVSIWSRNAKTAMSLAKKIHAGMIWINDSSFGLPNLPWGGWEKSGWGTLFSEHSLHEVTRMKWVSRHPALWAKPRIWWNPYTPIKKKIFLISARYFL